MSIVDTMLFLAAINLNFTIERIHFATFDVVPIMNQIGLHLFDLLGPIKSRNAFVLKLFLSIFSKLSKARLKWKNI